MRTKNEIDQDYTRVSAEIGHLQCKMRQLQNEQDKFCREGDELAARVAAEKKIIENSDLLDKGEPPNE